MKRMIGLVVVLLACTPAMAGYVFFENFESGVSGWNTWQQAGTTALSAEAENQTGANNPLYPLGNISPESGANAQSAHLNGTPSGNFNGGLWKVINVPTGVPLGLDGFWRCHSYKRNDQWSEVIVWDGAKTLANGTDYAGNGGSIGSANGQLRYKIYTNTAPDGTSAFAGSFSNTTLKAPVAYATNLGQNLGTSSTGKLTILLKFGHTSTSAKSIDWDDIYVTPEPSALFLGALGIPLFLRRRRA